MSELVLGEALVKCRYCRRPSQEESHEECLILVGQWRKDNFDMGEFWFNFVHEETVRFVCPSTNNIDPYYGFIPYILEVDEGKLIKFHITDQELHTTSYLHQRFCNSGERTIHQPYFMCYVKQLRRRRIS